MDEIGLLKVGPRSAGSHPGPASYGLGGTEPTVTDADFLLGYLNPGYFAGGEVTVDMAAARAAVERLAARLALDPVKVAWGIHDIVNENMAGAARVHIAERGRDPRDYALLCTGGGGPGARAGQSRASSASRASSVRPRRAWPRPWASSWRPRGWIAWPPWASGSIKGAWRSWRRPSGDSRTRRGR